MKDRYLTLSRPLALLPPCVIPPLHLGWIVTLLHAAHLWVIFTDYAKNLIQDLGQIHGPVNLPSKSREIPYYL